MRKFYKRNIFYFAGVAIIALCFQIWKFQLALKGIDLICGDKDIYGIMLTIVYLLIMVAEGTPIIQSAMWLFWG